MYCVKIWDPLRGKFAFLQTPRITRISRIRGEQPRQAEGGPAPSTCVHDDGWRQPALRLFRFMRCVLAGRPRRARFHFSSPIFFSSAMKRGWELAASRAALFSLDWI